MASRDQMRGATGGATRVHLNPPGVALLQLDFSGDPFRDGS